MATELSAITVQGQLKCTQSSTADQGTATHVINQLYQLTFTDGTSDDQVSEVFEDSVTLSSSADLDYDLAGGITDRFGNTLTLAAVKAIMLKNTSDALSTPTTNSISIGGGDGAAGTNAFDSWITSTTNDGSERVIVQPGGLLILVAPNAGYTVTAGTADILTIKNLATGQASYELTILGDTA